MKTAIVISGQARTFSRCLASQHFAVYRKLENPHFFVSVANDADADSMELLRKQYPNSPVFIEKVEQPLLKEPPASLALHAPYAISSPIQAILRQLWHLSRAYKFALGEGAGECDVFIRARADLHWHSFDGNDSYHIFQTIGTGPESMSQLAYVPYWGGYGGVNDRFAVMGHVAAAIYFQTWDQLPSLFAEGCPLHPESLVCFAMERAGITIHRTLAAEFAALRPNGELVHMVVLPQELAAYTAHLSRQ
jgi:hypothetical protein